MSDKDAMTLDPVGRGVDCKSASWGSIPPNVSIFKPLYNQPLWGVGHRFQLGQALHRWFVRRISPILARSAFWSGFEQEAKLRGRHRPAPSETHLQKLVQHHHSEHVRLATAFRIERERFIATSKELSALKKQKQK